MIKLLERGFKFGGTIAWILVAILAAATAVTWLARDPGRSYSYCHVYDRTFNLDWDPLGRT
jgi:hypothetical protein